MPVVSFFDPDDLIATRQLGTVPTDLDGMAEDLKHLISDNEARHVMAVTAKKYVLENYSPINVAKYYEALFV